MGYVGRRMREVKLGETFGASESEKNTLTASLQDPRAP
jgi:hypothetical protein